jgi:hypothetical protein
VFQVFTIGQVKAKLFNEYADAIQYAECIWLQDGLKAYVFDLKAKMIIHRNYLPNIKAIERE